jgi:hypothetical protein
MSQNRASPYEEIKTGVQAFILAVTPENIAGHQTCRWTGLEFYHSSLPGAEDNNHSRYISAPPPPPTSLHGLHTDRFTFISKVNPAWCTFYSVYEELRASTYFEHNLLILRWRCSSFTSKLVQPTDITRTQCTNCSLWGASWGWASNSRNM